MRIRELKIKSILTAVMVLGLLRGIDAQSSEFQIGTQIPLMYSAGYEFKTKGRTAINIQAGLLTKPYDYAIVEVLKMFGTKEVLANTIGEAFSYGFIFQPTVKFYFNHNYYAGVLFSYYMLTAKETPKDAIQNYYGIMLPPSYWTIPLQLQSNLSNLGLSFGRKFSFNNSAISLVTEFSFAKTFQSQSRLKTDSGSLDNLSNVIDKKLNEYYIKYGYLPSINFFIVIPF